jgi:hypothetical protein
LSEAQGMHRKQTYVSDAMWRVAIVGAVCGSILVAAPPIAISNYLLQGELLWLMLSISAFSALTHLILMLAFNYRLPRRPQYTWQVSLSELFVHLTIVAGTMAILRFTFSWASS